MFFSSRRRHTRYWRDWSSDVCSSDLHAARRPCAAATTVRGPPPRAWKGSSRRAARAASLHRADGRSTGIGPICLYLYFDWESVVLGKSVDLGGRRIIKKKKCSERVSV